MRCSRCDRVFQDGDTAFEIGVKCIKIEGKRVATYNETVYACEGCVKIEEGGYK
jgi:hypothetical protein